jgi:hypothetical protein
MTTIATELTAQQQMDLLVFLKSIEGTAMRRALSPTWPVLAANTKPASGSLSRCCRAAPQI